MISETTRAQASVEENVASLLADPWEPNILSGKHLLYLHECSQSLPSYFSSLDASRPWLAFWITRSLELLGSLKPSPRSRVADFLVTRCQDSNIGGFGGGPGQLPHLAPTYAAVMALVTMGDAEAMRKIDRPAMLSFLRSLKQPDGSFAMHDNGECDVRAVYCAIAVADVLGILKSDLIDGVLGYIQSCQTYEGGFGGAPGNEAHGGYGFCALAVLVVLKGVSFVDTSSLLRWMTLRQMKIEGGFQGRTNKLVDGCYSYWVGAMFAMLPMLDSNLKEETEWLFDEVRLQMYTLYCCQDTRRGGLKDKPGKSADPYHTCYNLCGLSISQHRPDGTSICIGNPKDNLILETNPVYNVNPEKLEYARTIFK